MDYRKAYNAALETARQWIKDGCTDKEKIALECIFPELRESEDERIRKAIMAFIKNRLDDGDGNPPEYLKNWLAWFEKQKEIPMPDSTQLIEWWDEEEAMLKDKDFRDDTWRIAQNAFIDGVFYGWRIKQKEQKPVEKQDYSGLSDFEARLMDCMCAAQQYPQGKIGSDVVKKWAEELIELCPRQNAEWSEEDEWMRNTILDLLSTRCSAETYDEIEAWLNSLPNPRGKRIFDN